VSQLHYHCVYCSSIKIRRDRFVAHLKGCKNASTSTSIHDVAPQTASTSTSIHDVAPQTVSTSTSIHDVAPQTASTSTSIHDVAPQTASRSFIKPQLRNSVVIKTKCPLCHITIQKKNLRKHLERKHTKSRDDITSSHHLYSDCIDRANGVYAVQKHFLSSSVPVHVVYKIWGAEHNVRCELPSCQVDIDLARRSGLSHYKCHHLRSLDYCESFVDGPSLSESTLSEMVKLKWFGSERKRDCLERQSLATQDNKPLSVATKVTTPSFKRCISVYEPHASYYAQLGRLMVTYDVKQNSWHCPCARSRRSCLHKYIAKWHLFQTEHQLFRTVQSTDQTSPVHESVDDVGLLYPPTKELESMIQYVMNNKTIPAALPENLRLPPFSSTYPTSLIPDEMFCHRCPGNVPLSDPLLITSKAKILTNTRIIHGKYYCGK